MNAAELASRLDADERTIRRAIDEGTIRARRPSPRRVTLTDSEVSYLEMHWPTLQQLRRALRTEPNVSAAALFGSAARGDDSAASDLDVFVWLRRDSAVAAGLLEQRLSVALDRAVQVTRADRADAMPRLLFDVVNEGRPLVDRDRFWPRLRRRQAGIRRAAAEAADRQSQQLAVEYGIELTAA
jgi:predicted nucleotidyltransferase